MSLPLHLRYRDRQLCFEDVPLATIAERVDTPTFVYSKAALVESYRRYADAIASHAGASPALVCYAVKANSNLAVLQVFAREGAGFDIVSGGELERVLRAGGDPGRVLFSGVGKTRAEMRRALDVGIRCFNVESVSEIGQLGEVARAAGRTAPVSIRVNPDVDAGTHPYVSTGLRDNKFGIAFDDALEAYRAAARDPHLSIVGIDCHIGSQLVDEAPLLDALERLLRLVERLDAEGIVVSHLDVGGGIGIDYGMEATRSTIDIARYVSTVLARIDAWRAERPGRGGLDVVFEPGRSLVGNAGVLLARVLVLKDGETKRFAVVDAAMNDLIRPSLYDAWHDVVGVDERAPGLVRRDFVGPICESGDWLARDRDVDVREGDLVAFLSAGAYAKSMASNYNSRPRAAEVIVDRDTVHVVGRRESVESLFAAESLLP